jgi:hypothetical protein
MPPRDLALEPPVERWPRDRDREMIAKNPNLRCITCHLAISDLEWIEAQVKSGRYLNRSDTLRAGLRLLRLLTDLDRARP